MGQKRSVLQKAVHFLFQRLPVEQYFGKGVQEDFKELAPPAQAKEAVTAYYEKKLAVTFCIIAAGSLLSFVLYVGESGKGELITTEDYSYVLRNNAEGEEKELSLVAENGAEQSELRLTVDPVRYTREEFYEICKELTELLPTEILGENKDLQSVSSPLRLLEHYGDYPVKVEWSMDDYTYIHTDGTVDTEALEEGERAVVMVTAKLTYEDYEFYEQFPIQLVGSAKEEQFFDGLKTFMEREQKKQSGKDKYILPEEYAGKAVFFSEQKSNLWLAILAVTIAAGVVLFFAQNRDLHKETEERREALLREYPEFVSKLMLFMGAGMTTKAAFSLLCSEYKKAAAQTPKEKHYLYEELKLMTCAMENSVYEVDAYEDFGRRCKVNQYRRLMGLLAQNSKKGTKDIIALLEAESRETFELRKSEAKKRGEKAATKLLLPMALMLGIVMAVIIVPAFLSYSL